MTNYPDHGSPARKARAKARQSLPCEACGAAGEPVLRRARPFSPEWERDKDAFFACPGCGCRLAGLTGAAAARPSDLPSDRLPDPVGLLTLAVLPELQRGLARWSIEGGTAPELVDQLVAAARRAARSQGIGETVGLRLPGREKVVPSLVLTGLGNPWLVAFCEIPGASVPASRSTFEEVRSLDTVEAVIRLTVIEAENAAKILIRIYYGSGDEPERIEGDPISLRPRRKGDR